MRYFLSCYERPKKAEIFERCISLNPLNTINHSAAGAFIDPIRIWSVKVKNGNNFGQLCIRIFRLSLMFLEPNIWENNTILSETMNGTKIRFRHILGQFYPRFSLKKFFKKAPNSAILSHIYSYGLRFIAKNLSFCHATHNVFVY